MAAHDLLGQEAAVVDVAALGQDLGARHVEDVVHALGVAVLGDGRGGPGDDLDRPERLVPGVQVGEDRGPHEQRVGGQYEGVGAPGVEQLGVHQILHLRLDLPDERGGASQAPVVLGLLGALGDGVGGDLVVEVEQVDVVGAQRPEGQLDEGADPQALGDGLLHLSAAGQGGGPQQSRVVLQPRNLLAGRRQQVARGDLVDDVPVIHRR